MLRRQEPKPMRMTMPRLLRMRQEVGGTVSWLAGPECHIPILA